MMAPLPNISHAYRILVVEQKHKEIGKQSLSSNDILDFVIEIYTFHNKPLSYHIESTSRNKGFVGIRKGYFGVKKQNIFLCDHCHMKGHTIDRCYKLHRYPSTHLDTTPTKKIANTAQIQDLVTTLNVFNPSFISEQYSYVMTLINKEKEQDHLENAALEEYTNSALLADKFCLLSKI